MYECVRNKKNTRELPTNKLNSSFSKLPHITNYDPIPLLHTYDFSLHKIYFIPYPPQPLKILCMKGIVSEILNVQFIP